MKRELFYSILRFREGLILGESLNAGILFFNPNSSEFIFEEGNLKRIAASYPDIKVNLLKKYIETLHSNIKKTQNDLNIELNSLENFISKELFFSDAAGLTFDTLERVPLSDQTSFQQTATYLKQLFLVGYGNKNLEMKKRNEEYILSEVHKILGNKDASYLSKIRRYVKIESPLVQYTFDFFWEGTRPHLTKAVSLDLENNSFIQNKALQLFGAFEQLQSQLAKEYKNPEIDLLVAKPQIKSNFSEFDKAVKILETVRVPIKIHFESEWSNYANSLIKNASKLAQDSLV
jgi:hypothetical protein